MRLELRRRGRLDARPPGIARARHIALVTSGRIALGKALECAGIEQEDEVLLPGFHCMAMVHPIRSRGARPVFYRLDSSAGVDLDDVEARISNRTRALVAVHYFGFPQDALAIRRFCDERNLVFVEDCAHAYFGELGGRPLGSFGHYAIASSMKFFPVFDGGVLASDETPLETAGLRSAGTSFELKALLRCLERASRSSRTPLGRLLSSFFDLKDIAWDRTKRHSARLKSGMRTPTASEGGFEFDPSWLNVRMSAASRLISANTDFARVIERRRRNFLFLLDALGDLPGAHALFAQVDEGVVPLVFPLYVEQPRETFHQLKMRRVPIYRFGEYLDPTVTAEVYRRSVELSEHVFQLPCHQDLGEKELCWIVDSVSKVFRRRTDAKSSG